jgi:hypothetical protein
MVFLDLATAQPNDLAFSFQIVAPHCHFNRTSVRFHVNQSGSSIFQSGSSVFI